MAETVQLVDAKAVGEQGPHFVMCSLPAGERRVSVSARSGVREREGERLGRWERDGGGGEEKTTHTWK